MSSIFDRSYLKRATLVDHNAIGETEVYSRQRFAIQLLTWQLKCNAINVAVHIMYRPCLPCYPLPYLSTAISVKVAAPAKQKLLSYHATTLIRRPFPYFFAFNLLQRFQDFYDVIGMLLWRRHVLITHFITSNFQVQKRLFRSSLSNALYYCREWPTHSLRKMIHNFDS